LNKTEKSKEDWRAELSEEQYRGDVAGPAFTVNWSRRESSRYLMTATACGGPNWSARIATHTWVTFFLMARLPPECGIALIPPLSPSKKKAEHF
jgi:hypothetical protein